MCDTHIVATVRTTLFCCSSCNYTPVDLNNSVATLATFWQVHNKSHQGHTKKKFIAKHPSIGMHSRTFPPPPTPPPPPRQNKGWRVGLQLCSPPCSRGSHRPAHRDLPGRPPCPHGRAARCTLPGAASASAFNHRTPPPHLVVVSGAGPRQGGRSGDGDGAWSAQSRARAAKEGPGRRTETGWRPGEATPRRKMRSASRNKG